MTTIATQIRARLDAIAAERARLDDEERRLKKALEALEETTVETSEPPGLEDSIRRLLDRMPPASPGLPTYPVPYPTPHFPPGYPWDGWVIPDGPQIGYVPPWHPVIGKARGDVVAAADINPRETICGCGTIEDHISAASAFADDTIVCLGHN